jgi:hypothetical protein
VDSLLHNLTTPLYLIVSLLETPYLPFHGTYRTLKQHHPSGNNVKNPPPTLFPLLRKYHYDTVFGEGYHHSPLIPENFFLFASSSLNCTNPFPAIKNNI